MSRDQYSEDLKAPFLIHYVEKLFIWTFANNLRALYNLSFWGLVTTNAAAFPTFQKTLENQQHSTWIIPEDQVIYQTTVMKG
jgi:hypothetical protein